MKCGCSGRCFPPVTDLTMFLVLAHVPVQLGPTEHLPLPPVGYQLVRDPITGHFLLIPATNIGMQYFCKNQ
jgi:hypothetical protein